MFRGISSFVLGRRLNPNPKHLFKGPSCRALLIDTSCFREYSSVGVEEGESPQQTVGRSADRSFTSTHYLPDGRKFQFATVVVRAMQKGESPVRLWEEACALIGGNSPTLAVAFVSKPTKSALCSVQALASQLSNSLSNVPPQAHDPAPSGRSTSSSASLPIGSEPPQAPLGPEDVPLIGCIMDTSGDIEASDGSGSGTGTAQVDPRGSRFRGSHSVAQGNGAHKLTCSVLGQSEAGLDLEEEEDDEDGTLSDWESLWSEFGEEALKVLDSSRGESDEEDEDGGESGPGADQISKEDLVGFLNALVKHRSPFEDSGAGGDLRAVKRGDRSAGVARGGSVARADTDDVLVTELERCLSSSGVGSACTMQGVSEGVFLGSNGQFGDYEGTITVEPRTRGDKAGVSGSDGESEDLNYKLVLCVGHMPGAKAVAFHSSTTGLPRLPDLENAILENNPHMLLLGAPGFVFPDFMQRLSSVFPASCRVGAFLSPLFTRKKNQWAPREEPEKALSPVFIGNQVLSSGVVGLSISSEVKGLEVPVGAFAELARMSLGMPRIPGYVYLDEAISKKLFLPDNIRLQNAFGSSVGSKAPPSSLLEQLSRRLLRESAVPLQPQASAVGRSTNPEVELSAGEALERSQLLSSGGAEEDLQALDRLPLALLDTVLFPGWSQPFYIYEPCYRLMVRQCVEQGKPFGLSSMFSGSWTADTGGPGGVVGTLANLKVHTFERDCRSYIIAQGLRRFRVVDERIWSEPGSFGLLMGQVQFFDDKECETAEEKQELLDLAKRAVSLCCKVVSEAHTAPGLVKSAHDPRLASFAIGHVLNVPTRVKRRWLKMVNTKTRLLEQMTFLEIKAPTSS